MRPWSALIWLADWWSCDCLLKQQQSAHVINVIPPVSCEQLSTWHDEIQITSSMLSQQQQQDSLFLFHALYRTFVHSWVTLSPDDVRWLKGYVPITSRAVSVKVLVTMWSMCKHQTFILSHHIYHSHVRPTRPPVILAREKHHDHFNRGPLTSDLKLSEMKWVLWGPTSLQCKCEYFCRLDAINRLGMT